MSTPPLAGHSDLADGLLHIYKEMIGRVRRLRRKPEPGDVFGYVSPDEIRAVSGEMEECRRQNRKLTL